MVKGNSAPPQCVLSDSEVYNNEPVPRARGFGRRKSSQSLTMAAGGVAQEYAHRECIIGDRVVRYDGPQLAGMQQEAVLKENAEAAQKVANSKAHSLDDFCTEPE